MSNLNEDCCVYFKCKPNREKKHMDENISMKL